MASMNKVILLGNLGQTPELRHTRSGASVCNLRLATNKRWTDKDGTSQERTEWHSVVVFGRQADYCAQYLKKGSCVQIEGQLHTSRYEDGQGIMRTVTEIKARSVQNLGPARKAA